MVVDSLRKIGKSLHVTVVVEPRDDVVDRARKMKTDLVVLDVTQESELEILSLLKTGRLTKDIAVVVIASEDAIELREMALEIGADGFIAKPLTNDFLPKLLLFLAGRVVH